ncbi:MAG: hypothetical protein C0475_01410 [Planctomyces sp.]|nr:hypothetical protein [Planctomyces sp.]
MAATCVLLPGLAADRRLFQPQLDALGARLIVPAWLAPEPCERLEPYAARLARSVTLPDGPYVLGGFSFGSQAAQEMVRHMPRRPAELLLLCGVRSLAQLTPWFHLQQRIGTLVPRAVAQRLYAPYARRFARRSGLAPGHAQLLVDMARGIDPAFLDWSTWACARWRGEPDLRHHGVAVPVRHLHGALDRVIPDPLGHATQTLADAGHLITYTHAAAVTAAIEAALARADAAGSSPG